MTDRQLTSDRIANGPGVSGDWASTEVANQYRPIRVADAGGGTDNTRSDTGLRRVFGPGVPITDDMIQRAGLANDADQLSLERNLQYRDANPKAYFKTAGLNDKIDQLTGTKGDANDPANLAVNVELSGTALQNVQILKNHEAVAKIEQWRQANPDKLSDGGFPSRLSPADIAQETSPVKIQGAINALYAEKGQPMLSATNIEQYGSLKAYHPDANFDDATAFTSDADKTYKQLLLAKRRELSGT